MIVKLLKAHYRDD